MGTWRSVPNVDIRATDSEKQRGQKAEPLPPRDPAVFLCIAVPRTLLCSKRYHRTGTPLEFPSLTGPDVTVGVIWDWCNPSSALRPTWKLFAEPCVKSFSILGMKGFLPFYLTFCFSEWTCDSFTWNWTTMIWLFGNLKGHFFPLPMSKAVYSSKEEVDHSPISYLGGF